jgi:hypothetical protein
VGPTSSDHSPAFRPYVTAVLAAGAILFLILFVNSGFEAIRRNTVVFWLITGLIILSELRPVEVPRRVGRETEEQTLSEIFAFTLLLGWGLGPSILAFSLGALIGQSILRRPLVKIVFNVAQLSLSLSAAGVVYYLLGGYEGAFSLNKLLAFLVAAYVYHVVNRFLVSTVIALHQRVPLPSPLRLLAIPRSAEVILIGMAPIILIVIQTNLLLAPLLVLPVFAVYLAMRSAMEAHQREIEAKIAEEQSRRLAELEKEVISRLEDNDRLREAFIAAIGREIWTPLIHDSMEVLAQYDRPPEAKHEESIETTKNDDKGPTDPSDQAAYASAGLGRSRLALFRHNEKEAWRIIASILGIVIAAVLPVLGDDAAIDLSRSAGVTAILIVTSTAALLTISLLVKVVRRSRIARPVGDNAPRHVQVLKEAYDMERRLLVGLQARGGPTGLTRESRSRFPDESSTTVDPTTHPRDSS